jgi:hypothetical protein
MTLRKRLCSRHPLGTGWHSNGGAVFFDDYADYIAGAREAGLEAYGFEGAGAVLERLAATESRA